jgi:hypothetical protein
MEVEQRDQWDDALHTVRVCMSVYLCVSRNVCMSMYLSACPSVHLQACLSGWLSGSLADWLTGWLSGCLAVSSVGLCLPVCLPVSGGQTDRQAVSAGLSVCCLSVGLSDARTHTGTGGRAGGYAARMAVDDSARCGACYLHFTHVEKRVQPAWVVGPSLPCLLLRRAARWLS